MTTLVYKRILQSQFDAALAMLDDCIENCPRRSGPGLLVNTHSGKLHITLCIAWIFTRQLQRTSGSCILYFIQQGSGIFWRNTLAEHLASASCLRTEHIATNEFAFTEARD